jgi:hypothetical protein
LDRLSRSDVQDDAGVLDLEPTKATVVGHCLKDRQIGVSQFQRARFASTHGAPSYARPRAALSVPHDANLLHDFCPATLGRGGADRSGRRMALNLLDVTPIVQRRAVALERRTLTRTRPTVCRRAAPLLMRWRSGGVAA